MYGHYFQLIFRTGRIAIKGDIVTKWTSPLQLPISLTHKELVHFVRQCAAAKQLSSAHCVHPPEGFYNIGDEVSYVIKNTRITCKSRLFGHMKNLFKSCSKLSENLPDSSGPSLH